MAEQNWTRETDDTYEHTHVQQVGPYEERHTVVENTGVARAAAIYKLTQVVWLLFGLLEALIGLRIVLKLIGANPASAFAAMIYNITDFFLWPFFGLTATPGVGTFVLEIPSIIAMVVYALLAWLIVKVLHLMFPTVPARTVTHYERDIR